MFFGIDCQNEGKDKYLSKTNMRLNMMLNDAL